MLKASPLPSGNNAPAYTVIAASLTPALPATHRAAARSLLVDELLPLMLRDVSVSDKPHGFVQVVYDGLVKGMHETAEQSRLRWLRVKLLRAQLQQLSRAALSLAIARYLAAHPDAVAKAKQWLRPPIPAARLLSVAQILSSLATQTSQLIEWKQRASAYPDLWQDIRSEHLAVLDTLRAARTATFTEPVSSFADFLEDMGEDVDEERDF